MQIYVKIILTVKKVRVQGAQQVEASIGGCCSSTQAFNSPQTSTVFP